MAPEAPTPQPEVQLRWSAAEIGDHIQHALRVRRRVTERSRDLKEQFHAMEDDDTPLNHPFEFCRSMVSQLVFSRPTCRVTEGGHVSDQTEMVGVGLKNLIGRPDWGFIDTFEAIATDIQFDFGVGFIHIEPTPDWEGAGPIPFWPVVKRISPCMYIRDARTPDFGGKPRFEGHMCVAYKDDLLRQTDSQGAPLYDPAAVAQLADGDGLSQLRQDLAVEGVQLSDDTGIVVFWELYFHAEQAWATVGFHPTQTTFLRVKPCRGAYGCPAGGPYILFGDYPSIDQVYPVANLAVTKALVEDINKHRRSIRDDAAKAKKFVVVSAGSDQVIQAITTAPGSSVLAIPGFNGILQEAEIGGPAKESVAYTEVMTANLDRMSGLSNVARGDLQSSTTATAVAQAGAFTSSGMRRAKSRFLHKTADALAKVADLIMHCPDVRFPVSINDPQSGQQMRVELNGGQIDPPTSPWRSRIQVEIEPYSQEYVDQTQLRQDMTEAFQMVLAIMQAAAMDPTLKPEPMINDLLQTLNIPEAAKKYIDTMLLNGRQKMLEMQMGMQVQAMMTGGLPPAPGQPPGVPAPQGPQKPEGRGRPGNGPGARHPGLPPGKPGGIVRGQPAPVG